MCNSSLSDLRLEALRISVEQKTELIEELTTELSMYLAMLYTMLEVFRGDETISEELSMWLLHLGFSQ